MSGHRSPGLNGMSPNFYSYFWNINGEDVVCVVRSFFADCLVSRAINHTFFALIPRRSLANKIDQFRSLLYVMLYTKSLLKSEPPGSDHCLIKLFTLSNQL